MKKRKAKNQNKSALQRLRDLTQQVTKVSKSGVVIPRK